MTAEFYIIHTAVCTHIAVCIACFTYWYARNRGESLYRFAVALFLPVLGILYLLSLWLLEKFKCGCESAAVFENSAPLCMERARLRKETDVYRTINLVPLEEALAINSTGVKRRVMMDILKDEPDRHLFFLRMALEDDDPETSHYAAAAIDDIRRRLTSSVVELRRKYEQDTTDAETAAAYVKSLKAYLDSGLADESSRKRNRDALRDVLTHLLQFYAEGQVFADKINCDIEAGDFSSAAYYCRRFLQMHRQSEEPYLLFLKLFYLIRDRESFNEMLLALKKAPVNLSVTVAGIIGFWSEGG